MIVEKNETGGREIVGVERWTQDLLELHAHVPHRFRGLEVRERARRHLSGLLGGVNRKNGWQMDEAGPQGAQRLLNGARWDADGIRDDLIGYVIEHLGNEASGMLIVDETGFLKKGGEVGGCPAPVFRDGGQNREPPGGRSVRGLCLQEGSGLRGSGVVPARRLDA